MVGPNELQFFVKLFVFSSVSLEKIHRNGSKFFLFSNKISTKRLIMLPQNLLEQEKSINCLKLAQYKK